MMTKATGRAISRASRPELSSLAVGICVGVDVGDGAVCVLTTVTMPFTGSSATNSVVLAQNHIVGIGCVTVAEVPDQLSLSSEV